MKLNSVAGGLIGGLAGASVIGGAILGINAALNAGIGDPTIKSNPTIEFVNQPITAELFEVKVTGSDDTITLYRIVDKEKGVLCYVRNTYDARPLSCVHDLSVIEKEMTPSEEELAWINSKK